ncbi:MAG: radical SAM protein [Acidimicrobiia bacterium]
MRGDAGFPVRLRFSKHGPVRFISHRDVARALERAFRIAELPLVFTRGYSPHPKLSFGPALAVGYESDAEYLDLELDREIDPVWLASAVTEGLPQGMAVTGVSRLADRAASLQEIIGVLSYRVVLDGGPADLVGRAVEALVARDRVEVPVVRKGEEQIDDIRPSVLALAQPRADEAVVVVDVATRPRTLRVADVVTGLRAVLADAAPLVEQRVVRTHQWVERGGARLEPLDVDQRSAAPTGAQAHTLEACA